MLWFVKNLPGDTTNLCYIQDFAISEFILKEFCCIVRIFVFMAYDCLMHPSYSALKISQRNAYWSDKRSFEGVLLLWISHNCLIGYSIISVFYPYLITTLKCIPYSNNFQYHSFCKHILSIFSFSFFVENYINIGKLIKCDPLVFVNKEIRDLPKIPDIWFYTKWNIILILMIFQVVLPKIQIASTCITACICEIHAKSCHKMTVKPPLPYCHEGELQRNQN